MTDYCRVQICGELVERPDLSETGNGKRVAWFWVKIVRRWMGRVETLEETVFVRCQAVGYPCNSVAKYGLPRVRVMVEGYLRSFSAPDENGQARTELYVQVEHLAYLSPREVMEANAKATS